MPKRTSILCPECLEPATKAELKKYGGICEACRDAHEEEDAMSEELHRQEMEHYLDIDSS